LRWCARFGLLGVLPHRVETVVFPAQVLSKERRKMSTQTRLVRTPRGWHVSGDLRDPEDAPISAHVLIHGWSSFEITQETFETWSRYFPNFPPDLPYEYLSPDTDAFFRFYQEPLVEFFRAALEITKTLSSIARFIENRDDLESFAD